MVDKAKRTTISISQQIKSDLDSLKHPGQSYNGLIQELVKFWKQKKGTKR
jgi:predicted CopG family antitoxin